MDSTEIYKIFLKKEKSRSAFSAGISKEFKIPCQVTTELPFVHEGVPLNNSGPIICTQCWPIVTNTLPKPLLSSALVVQISQQEAQLKLCSSFCSDSTIPEHPRGYQPKISPYTVRWFFLIWFFTKVLSNISSVFSESDCNTSPFVL